MPRCGDRCDPRWRTRSHRTGRRRPPSALHWSLLFAVALSILLFPPRPAKAQTTEIVLHSFDAPKGGYNADSGVFRDQAGSLYGTMEQGGSIGAGVVFKINRDGSEIVLHDFRGSPDGADPESSPVMDASGNLYGTTGLGGAYNRGAVYKIDPAGNETILHSFDVSDGEEPQYGLIVDSAGELHSFTGGADGGSPESGVIRDPVGNLYGSTPLGGLGYGVIYRIGASGSFSVL